MAELNRLKIRLLGNYNSLLDKHLTEYFSNPRIRRHLLRAGLIRQNGDIVSPEDYKARVLEEQRWLASQAFLAQAIVQRALDLEFSRRAQLQKQLEEIIRLELVERIRSAKHKNVPPSRSRTPSSRCESRRDQFAHRRIRTVPSPGSILDISKRESATFDIDACDDDSGSQSSDIDTRSSADFALQSKTRATCSANSRLQGKSASPYSIPLMNGKHRPVSRTRSAVYTKSRPNLNRKGVFNYPSSRAQTPGLRNIQYSCCEMAMKFLGTRSFFSRSVNGGRQEVLIKQQLAGGNPVVVFYEPLIPGSLFTFTSRRYIDFPFSVTIYVDSILVLRLSACCEYKYGLGNRLGGSQGYFILTGVHGSRPCLKCCPRKKNRNSLPPVRNNLSSGFGTTFKSSSLVNNKPAWSQRQYSAKQVALIPPSGKSSDKLLNTKDQGSWVLNVGISPLVDDFKNGPLTDSVKKESLNVLTKVVNEEKENDSEDDITEEIVSELKRIEEVKSLEVAEVVEEIEEDNSKMNETESVDSDTNSTASSSTSGNSYTSGSSSVTENTVEGPVINVIKADGTRKTPSSSVSSRNTGESDGSDSTSSGSSYTESETEEETTRQFLKPEDAEKIKSNEKKIKEAVVNSPNNEEAQSKKNEVAKEVEKSSAKSHPALEKHVAIDTSDEEGAENKTQKTIVQADIHTPAEENESKNEELKASVITQDSLCADTKLDRQQSLTVGTVNGRRNSICHIVRNLSNASDDGDKDFNDLESQSSSVQDNGIEVEVVGQDLSGQIPELAEELQQRPDLITLTISKGGIDDLNIGPIIDALIYSKCPLKSLNLNYNHLGPQAGQQIARLVYEKPTLNHLFLRGNPLHDSGLCPIVSALLANNSALNSSDENDSSHGLHTLDVGNSNFRNEGATDLASLIEQSRHLRTLILSGNNQLNDDDWSSIFWAVGQNSAVSTLFLDYCYIGDEGVDCFTKIVDSHPALQAIDLEWNQIGDEGGKILVSWVKQNPKLDQLRIECGNNIKETIISDLNKGLENKK